MESGLEDRNNGTNRDKVRELIHVSMESGLEDRNNHPGSLRESPSGATVSMESGLEDRNNELFTLFTDDYTPVSMESGLEDRNNLSINKSEWELQFMSQWSPA